MKIVLNTSFLLQPEWTGVCWYVYYLLESLAKVRHQHQIELLFFVPPAERQVYQKLKFPPNIVKHAFFIPQRFCEPLDQWWARLSWPSLESLVGPHDVYLSPAWSYLPSHAPVTGILAYDTTAFGNHPLTHNQALEQHRLTTALAKHVSIWITLSRFSKQKLIDQLNIPPEKIMVAYPGLPPVATTSNSISPLNHPYVFYVGSADPRKNLDRAMQSIKVFQPNHPDWQFVIMSKDHISLNKQCTYPWLKLLPYGTSQAVQTYLHHAQALVYPSLEEGFGLPVLEALSAGTLAVTSRHSSMVEITGPTWPFLCDPYSVSDMTDCLEKVAACTPIERTHLFSGLDLHQFDYAASAELIFQKLEFLLAQNVSRIPS